MALVFLCGQKSCGKTYFLNYLKEHFFCACYDLDQEILENIGCTSLREYYLNCGESEFRRTELQVFEDLIKKIGKENAFVALGGGAVALMRRCKSLGKTVYLYHDKEILFNRMKKEGLPPFIKNKQSFEELFKERDKIYRENATCVVDLNSKKEIDVCQTLLEMYLS